MTFLLEKVFANDMVRRGKVLQFSKRQTVKALKSSDNIDQSSLSTPQILFTKAKKMQALNLQMIY